MVHHAQRPLPAAELRVAKVPALGYRKNVPNVTISLHISYMRKHDYTISGGAPAHPLLRFFVVLIALAHLSIGFANSASLSHSPHGHDGLTHEVDHSHDHADATDDDSPSGGHHDAADHSHDKPNLPPMQVARALSLTQTWACGDPRRDYASPTGSLERPPKSYS